MSKRLACFLLIGFLVGPARAQDKELPPKIDPAPVKTKVGRKKDEAVRIQGTLNAKDPYDKVRPGRHHKVYDQKLSAGKTYVIEMIKHHPSALDPFLRLEDSAGKSLMQDDDSAGSQNARIIFACTKDDEYRIIASSFDVNQVGNYLITVQVVPPGAAIVAGGHMALAMPLTFGDVIITPLPAFGRIQNTGGPDADTHGYIEYRFLIENDSESETHHVRLTLPHGNQHGYRMGHHLQALRKAVEVSPGGSVPVSVFQPDLPLLAANAEVEIDGHSQPQGLPFGLVSNRGNRTNPYYGGGSRSGTTPVIMVQNQLLNDQLRQQVYKSAVGVATKPPTHGFGGSHGGTYNEPGPYFNKPYTYYECVRFYPTQASPDTWSRSWLGYSSLDGVALTGDAWLGTPPEVQAAITQWVECGGTLLLIGAAKLPESWDRVKEDSLGFDRYYPGFGQCIVARKVNFNTKKVDVATWDPDDWRMVLGMWQKSTQAWQQVRNPTAANVEFEIVEGISIPVRSLFVVMVVFVLVIGPINVYWLARSRRRIWLLWTVPVFSLLTCVILVGYMVATEGWHGHARSQSITVLDEGSQRAATIGWQGYYCPTTPASGLHFPIDLELTPHLNFGSGRHNSTRHPYSVDWTSEQNLTDGWVTAKVPIHFMVRRNEKRLERLTVRKDNDGTLAIVNGLGADVASLWLADSDGKLHTAKDVRAGSEAKLQAAEQRIATGLPKGLNDVFAGAWLQVAEGIAARPNEYLRPGCYIAIIDDSPFLEQGLRRTQTRTLRSVVFGILKEAP